VRDIPGDLEMQPKLSEETKDLMMKVTIAAGTENSPLVNLLAESAYVDGAAETIARLQGTVAAAKREPRR
jgi:hypothetical protein